MSSMYKMGLEHQTPVPIVDNLLVNIGLWRTAENRFYSLGINPSLLELREQNVVGRVSDMFLDVVHIGGLMLAMSAIRTTIG